MKTIGVTGHQDLDAHIEDYARGCVAELFASLTPPLALISSLARGADQLVAEEALKVGADLIAVVPAKGYERTFEGVHLSRYREFLRLASEVVHLDFASPSEDAYFAAGQAVIARSELVVAIWDGLGTRGRGGTADAVAFARSLGREIVIVWPAGAKRA